ncbi:acyl-CoA dehydrogenase family protein [Streptomyces avicenniae]|uniref:acyl-CoA dehydrogenase family protein n=1 Tax=Streptomyces avicenniae TaxID=500153 RepID=UPI00069BBEFE|nr:acyl-CoA dehydrogenase family protein [Streptomyces avicenniae]
MSVSARGARRIAQGARRDGRAAGFAHHLFLGRLRMDLIHPGPTPDPATAREADAFLARLADFCRTSLDGPAIERDAHVPDETLRGLAALGAFGMRIDPAYGGLGLGHVPYHRALALVASASPAVAALLAAHQSTGVTVPLALHGTDEQRRAFLPRCARGAISAFLLAEPDAGSDPSRLAATATPDGDGYLLDGVKLWTTGGAVAELLLVLARVPDAGVTAFVVEADAPGVTVEHRSAFMGLRGTENGLVRLHAVRVPAAHRVGAEGEGPRIAAATLAAGRTALPAMCAGAGKWCLRIAREWSGARVQWGGPIAGHEAVGARIAFIAATAFALDAVVELTGGLADAPAPAPGLGVESALAKLYAGEMAWRVADDLVQIRGGRGYETAASLTARGERGVPAEQFLRDLGVSRVHEGSADILHLLIAREAIGAHLDITGDLVAPDASLTRKRRAGLAAGRFYARWLPTLAVGRGHLPLAYGDFHISGYPDLAAHLRWAERSARRLARATFYGVSRWPGRLEARQGFLARVVDIGAELFAVAAACAHAERLRAAGDHGRTAYELADAFCHQARLRAEHDFRALWHNADKADVTLAARVMDERYLWLEDGVLDPSTPGPWIAPATPGPSSRKNEHRAIR